MARGRQFTQLISDLRAELRRNNDPGVRAADLPSIQQAINRAYESLYDEYDWSHLITTFEPIALSAGQRYYDFPDEMDFDRMEEIKLWFSEQPYEITRGITLADYAIFNSEAATPDRSDPVLKWDVRNVDGSEQMEVWPIPSTNDQTIQFRGVLKFARLVDDADLCRLDDKAVVLQAALALEKDKDALKEKSFALERRLGTIRGRSKSGSSTVRMGLGTASPAKTGVTVRIG